MNRCTYLMCPSCFNVYMKHMLTPQIMDNGRFGYYCPDYDCYGYKELVGLDELMIPAVKKLNTLGYYIAFCCSGHMRIHDFHDFNKGYIKFQPYRSPGSAPKGWHIDKDVPGDCVIRVDRGKPLAESIENLMTWVISLEPYKEDEDE